MQGGQGIDIEVTMRESLNVAHAHLLINRTRPAYAHPFTAASVAASSPGSVEHWPLAAPPPSVLRALSSHVIVTTRRGVCTHNGFFLGLTTVTRAISNCTILGPRRVHLGAQGGVPLVVTGCARRIATKLQAVTIPYLDVLLTGAQHRGLAATVLIFHDDPSDNETLAVLHGWAARERRVRLVLSDMGDRGERIQRLTLCRNTLLAESALWLRKAAEGALARGFIAMLDLDCDHGKPDGMLQAIDRGDLAVGGFETGEKGKSGRFDVLAANNFGAYRDMWALRSSKLHMNYDCFWDAARMRTFGNCKRHRIFVHPAAPPFAVEAAFNGMAIYSAATVMAQRVSHCRYSNETADPDTGRAHVVCEHVPYQQCLVKGGMRIGIVPSLLTNCHDWATRHDAFRTFVLPNGSVTRLMKRHLKPDQGWTYRGGRANIRRATGEAAKNHNQSRAGL